MGYYTQHELSIINSGKTNIDIHQCIKEIAEISGYNESMFMSAIKWSDHREDMIELSKRYPTAVFCLKGDGEEDDDIWKEYYHNRKYQYTQARLVFDEFDYSKLS